MSLKEDAQNCQKEVQKLKDSLMEMERLTPWNTTIFIKLGGDVHHIMRIKWLNFQSIIFSMRCDPHGNEHTLVFVVAWKQPASECHVAEFLAMPETHAVSVHEDCWLEELRPYIHLSISSQSQTWSMSPFTHGRLARWIKWRSCDVGEAKEGLENELWRRWSNGGVGEWAVT